MPVSDDHLEAIPPSARERPGGLHALVAVDGSKHWKAALLLAADLETAGRITPTLVSTAATWPVDIPGKRIARTILSDALHGDEAERDRERAVRAQALNGCRQAAGWPIQVTYGYPADAIDSAAVEADAELIIIGLRRFFWIKRAAMVETTLELLRKNHSAVLAVVGTLKRMPRCIVVGMDFSRASQRAAQLAARLLAPAGRLLLVFARMGGERATEDGEGGVVPRRVAVTNAVAEIGRTLDLPPAATLETHVIDAAPRTALRRVVRREGADFIAINRQYAAPFARVLVGSIAIALLRGSSVSVLATPSEP